MKVKLIQILLGAIGSAITVIISHMASVPPEITLTAAAGAGPMVAVTIGDAVSSFFA